jgi:hypothetical protein
VAIFHDQSYIYPQDWPVITLPSALSAWSNPADLPGFLAHAVRADYYLHRRFLSWD